MKKPLLFLFSLFISCQTTEKKNENFDLKNHLKSNEWCSYNNKSQTCFIFRDNKMIVSKNGLDEAIINVSFKSKNDRIIVVKLIGKKGIEYQFKMKSMDTLYFKGDENEVESLLTRSK